LDCSIETARGALSAREIAEAAACTMLSYGGIDLALDLGVPPGDRQTLVARSLIVLAARTAGKPSPSDGVHVHLSDIEGLRSEAEAARDLGFFGKSAIHPVQVPVINEVFSPQASDVDWARMVVEAFDAAGGSATRLASGEFVDRPVAERARLILQDLDATSQEQC